MLVSSTEQIPFNSRSPYPQAWADYNDEVLGSMDLAAGKALLGSTAYVNPQGQVSQAAPASQAAQAPTDSSASLASVAISQPGLTASSISDADIQNAPQVGSLNVVPSMLSQQDNRQKSRIKTPRAPFLRSPTGMQQPGVPWGMVPGASPAFLAASCPGGAAGAQNGVSIPWAALMMILGLGIVVYAASE